MGFLTDFLQRPASLPVRTVTPPPAPEAPPLPPPEDPVECVRFGEFPAFSTIRLTGNPGSQRMFVTPVAQNGQGFEAPLTWAQTNLREGGRIPGFGIEVYRVDWVIWSDDMRAAEQVVRDGCWCWDFCQTSVDGGPLDSLRGEEALMTELLSAGRVLRGALVYEKTTLTIPAGVSFAILLRFGPELHLNTPVFVRFVLSAHHKNAIEIG